MTRRARPARSFLGIPLGATLGALAYVIPVTLASPSPGFAAAVAVLGRAARGAEPLLWVAASLGALAGLVFFAVPARAGKESAGAARAFGRGLVVLVGTAVGALAGIAAFVLLWIATFPRESLETALVEVGGAAAAGSPTLGLLVGSGSLVGFSVTAWAVGSGIVQRVARGIVGMVFGGLAGLVIYAVAYVGVNHPEFPDSANYYLHFGEAVTAFSPLEGLFVGLGSTLGLLMGRYSWRFYGLVTLVSLVSVILGFVGYSLFVTLPQVESPFRPLAIALFVAEILSLSMVLLYSFYTIDVATRKHWRKGAAEMQHSPYHLPKVAFQVCCYNEPPELVLDTLERLRRVRYPADRFLIQVLDDSTNPASADPVRSYCERHGLQYLHRKDRRGFKAGALNDALRHTPDDVDVFAVIDADYHVAPEYLAETVGYFANPDVAWVQTPQDYRNRHQSFLTEQYYLADAYFYRTVMPSRNEENTIIFCGTMGLVRRDALVEVGGWGEKYISEDAELSLRLLLNGYDSLYLTKTYGRGLIPATFEGYKKQHYRWAFGGAKILRGHFWRIFFGRLSRRQRFDYFVGSAHWFEGLLILSIAIVMALLALGEVLRFRVVTHHTQEILLVGLLPVFVLTDGITRLHMVMRERLQLSLRQTVRVLGMWFSVKFSNAFGAGKSFLGFHMPFVRTPKAPRERLGRVEAFRRALRVTRFESFMATLFLLLVAALGHRVWSLWRESGVFAPARVFLGLWLVYYLLIFLSAPLYAYRSYVTFRPEGESGIRQRAPARGVPH